MSDHEKFHYGDESGLKQDIERLGLDIPFGDSVDSLKMPLRIGKWEAPNRMAVLPMEGCDGQVDGTPGELTERRYRRFGEGGAGILWFEATAVAPEGRANPRQLWLNEKSAPAFGKLLSLARHAAKAKNGEEFRPLTVLQLTHSGRYSKPDGTPHPIVAAYNPWLDTQPQDKIHVISDDEIEALEEQYVQAALLAAELGFDAVDIKSCHGYLGAELLAAYSRPGRYGGSFENRTRFVCNIVRKVRERARDAIQIAVRMNAYDSVPYPYGWGVNQQDFHRPDYTEPALLVEKLSGLGVSLFNVTCGNPYYNPHVNRPYDAGTYRPPFHPLEGVATLLGAARAMQKAAPGAAVMATGFSWLRQWGITVAAAAIQQGWFSLAGFGRLSFAYPDFAKDVMNAGRLDTSRVCLACSKCTTIMRDGGMSGCVLRDAPTYAPIYRAGRAGKDSGESVHLAENVLGR
jgi:2,4-dienoyl-CoA reductase-like NADH-dependent reductase (Old Yellow Enzyme family)